MPDFVPPELATLVSQPPNGADWLHEMKLDGYRLQLRIDHGAVKALTRRGLDWSQKFRPLIGAISKLKARQALIDGEAVVMKPSGHSDYNALQQALGEGRTALVFYYAFDLLYLDGHDLRAIVLEQRKAMLENLLRPLRDERVRYCEHIVGSAEPFYRRACELQLEGVVSKRRNSPYRSERSDDWRKIKCVQRQEFVIGGWRPFAPATRAIGSLLIGHFAGDAFRFAGKVGTGFNEKNAAELMRRLDPLKQPWPAFVDVPRAEIKETRWVRPEIVIEVEFTEWTKAGQIRHPSFKGVREDKAAREVRPELPVDAPPPARARPRQEVRDAAPPAADKSARPSARAPTSRAAPRRVARDNIMRLLDDAVVPPREDLARYWRKVAGPALAHIARRPLTLVRHVGGLTFFHKGKLPPVPDAVHQLRFRKRGGAEGVRVWVDDLAGLLGLLDMDVVEVHPWGATVEDIEHPDLLVFDLDPGPGIDWGFVGETALAMRGFLADEGLEAWPKSTGGKGLHLMVPIAAERDWAEVRRWTKMLMERFARRDARYTTSSSIAGRANKLFLDYLRNGRGNTGIGAWSPRARSGFPIARPLTWAQVERGTRSDSFTMAKPGPLGRSKLAKGGVR